MEYCRVDDTSEQSIVGLPRGRADHISAARQPGGTWPPSTWWSKRRTSGRKVIQLGIRSCHVTKETEPSRLNEKRNRRASGSLPDSGVGNVSGVRDPKASNRLARAFVTSTLQNYTPTPGGHSLCTTWLLCRPGHVTSIRACIIQYLAVPMRRRISVSLYTTVLCGTYFQVCEFINQLDGCIIAWNAYSRVFRSKRSAICAQAVYFLHSTRPSVTWLNSRWWLAACEWVMSALFAVFSTRVARRGKFGRFML